MFLGLDACLMSMAEIAYEMKDCAQYFIAPEGLGPGRGWPFRSILKGLTDNSSMTGSEFGTMVLSRYSARYRDFGGNVKMTISLCSLKHAPEFRKAMRGLSESLRQGVESPDALKAIIRARHKCPFYRFPTYIDLYQFCRLLKRQNSFKGDTPIRSACEEVEKALYKRFVER